MFLQIDDGLDGSEFFLDIVDSGVEAVNGKLELGVGILNRGFECGNVAGYFGNLFFNACRNAFGNFEAGDSL